MFYNDKYLKNFTQESGQSVWVGGCYFKKSGQGRPPLE